MKQHLFIFVLAVITCVAPLLAHHSFAAEFDSKKPVELKGTLIDLEWVNPHAWLHVDVKGEDGKVTNWAIEFGSPNALLRRGLRKTDFPEGLQVVINGFRAKNGAPSLWVTRIRLANGQELKLDSGN